MKKTIFFSIILFLSILIPGLLSAQTNTGLKSNYVQFTFENIKIGKIPGGWKIEATNKKGALATWMVTEDKTAPSGNKVLELVSPNHHFGGTFNLCWTNNVSFLNGEIRVMFKANKGEEDEGGGVIWRAKDKGNYYIARYNPLENNFRIYYVKDEARKILASARVKLPAHKWYELKIIQNGNHISGYLNGNKYLDAEDNTFPEPGGVGLWTKADAATSFDDFTVFFKN